MQKTWWEATRRPAWMLPLVAFVFMTLIVFHSLHSTAGTPTVDRLVFAMLWGMFVAFFGLIAALIIGTFRWAAQRRSVPAWQPPQPTWQPSPQQALQPAYRSPASLPLSPAAAQVAQRARDAVAQAAQAPAPLAPLRPAPVRAAPAAVDLSDPERLNRILSELDAMPGLGHVSDQVRSMARRMTLDQARRSAGLKIAETGMSAVFVGPPGTAKTSVARIWGKGLAALGMLPSGHVIEVDRGALVGQHVGSTAIKTSEVLDRARGGLLFIDEAYSLSRESGGGPDFGQEAIETILKRMEDERGDLAVIVAGYPREMETFLASNPGLSSRFSHTVEFPHYDAPTLVLIAESMAAAKDYEWSPDALMVLRSRLTRLAARPRGWANARSVRGILDGAISAQADRLDSARGPHDRDTLALLTAEDVTAALDKRYPQDV